MTKRAIITGITGQDGSYLAELLLEKGYAVTGMIRRASAPNLWRIEHLLGRIDLRPADLLRFTRQARDGAQRGPRDEQAEQRGEEDARTTAGDQNEPQQLRES